ncbi:MAG TPA: dihydrofolate reductase [Bacteroidales bacterium]|nr:dihydrofolate reductase [Bacteroidales bacterium]
MIHISLIAAMDNKGLIGTNNDIPWHIPHDLKRFKQITSGHTVVMGRQTFESLPGPLPKRRNIVITSNRNYKKPGIEVVHSIEDALRIVDKKSENFVVGGAAIYEQFLPFADKLYLTRIKAVFKGDTYFPKVDFSNWKLVNEEHHQTEDEEPLKFIYEDYVRTSRQDNKSKSF